MLAASRKPGLIRSFGALIRGWWNYDRVRAMPSDGRLLRLSPPCIVCVNGRTAEVVGREVCRTRNGPYVRYHCITEDGPAELNVRLVLRTLQASAQWIEKGRCQALLIGDVVVFG